VPNTYKRLQTTGYDYYFVRKQTNDFIQNCDCSLALLRAVGETLKLATRQVVSARQK